MTMDLSAAKTVDGIFVEQEHTFKLRSEDKFVEFRASTRESLKKAAEFAANMLWDSLHREEQDAKIAFLKLQFAAAKQETAAPESDEPPDSIS